MNRFILGRRRRVGRAAALGVLAALAAAPAAYGATAPVTGTISSGPLSLATSAAPSFATTLDGTDQTVGYTLPLSALDATGSGSGWNVTITSTQLTTGGGAPRTLPATASAVSGVVAGCAATSCTAPTNGVTYPLTVPAGAVAPTAVKLYNAAADSGLGSFTVTPSVQVTVPGNAYAGIYTSTVTLAIASGP
jgi:hypothetical protein